jgi:hypothetical protein
MAGLAAALLLLLAGCLRGATAAAGAPAPARQAGQLSDAAFERATVVIEDADARRPVILQSLFNGTLDTIIFDIPSFTLVPAAWVFVTPETPYVLTRNFTILSQLTPPTVIDFSFLEGKVVMEPSTSFGFDGVALLKTT